MPDAGSPPAHGGQAPGRPVALSVHGPLGVLDLVVPSGASTWDVAREYAERSGLGTIPLLFSKTGTPLPPDVALADGGVVSGVGSGGVVSGSVLVATTGAQRPRTPSPDRGRTAARDAAEPGLAAGAWFLAAAAAATLAGWLTASSGTTGLGAPVVLLLLGAALVGVLPLGRLARLRALTAPAFAGAAAYPLLWDPDPLHLPAVVGGAALVAAVTAAVARALSAGPDEGLLVWVVAGAAVFVVAALCALLGAAPAVVWSVLMLLAMLASRSVPVLAVDVADHHLIDVERLAASAWSAREAPRGRRGRIVVSLAGVAAAADRAVRTTTAACAAITAVVLVSAPQLLSTAADEIDLIGAQALIFFVGASLLLAARSYRHPAPRALLRVAGLSCWAVLAARLLVGPAHPHLHLLTLGASTLAAVLVVAAVATGRGWRSVWWSRRAEVAESVAGTVALASIVVSSGLFVALWELTSANAPSR